MSRIRLKNFMTTTGTLSSAHRSVYLTFGADLFASFICKWVKNSDLYELRLSHFPSHDTQCCLLSSARLLSTLGHGLMRQRTGRVCLDAFQVLTEQAATVS